MKTLKERKFEREFTFRSSLSSGRGGQHVNKVSTKVELIFNIPGSGILDDDEKALLNERLKSRLSSTGDLRIISEASRSNLKNKNDCIRKFYELMQKSLKRPKPRKPTKPSKAATEKRHKAKQIKSERKERRKKIDPRSY